MLKSVQGFTLIELLIAVIIVGIVAAIALPSYTKSIEKSRRVDAKVGLVELSQLQEDFFADQNSYTDSFSQLLKLNSGDTEKYGFKLDNENLLSKDEYYLISFPADGNTNLARNFTLRADVVAGKAQADDKNCSWFTIDAIGNKTAEDGEGDNVEDCW